MKREFSRIERHGHFFYKDGIRIAFVQPELTEPLPERKNVKTNITRNQVLKALDRIFHGPSSTR